MKTLEMESLDAALRRRIRKAKKEPLVVRYRGNPILVIRDFVDDDVADELIAQSPTFRRTVKLARKQKILGHVKTLAELRRKYK